jgi:DNA excision repair protein ERCC-4
LLHKRGIDLEPLTLDVGDYILTPDICVERKSISDLIGSLNTGRLYKQAEAMGRHYKKPILLIEQEQLKGMGSFRSKNDLTQVMPKLQVLTMNFPNLRLIWSPGAHYTSEVFQELKKGKAQPSPDEAMAIQKEAVGEHISTKYSPIPHSFISRMPGIDSRNVYSILNRFNSLQELANAPEKELEETLENSHTAAVLYAGIHSETLTSDTDAATSSKLKSVKALVGKQKKLNFRVRGKGN